jgi:hypothetical protein
VLTIERLCTWCRLTFTVARWATCMNLESSGQEYPPPSSCTTDSLPFSYGLCTRHPHCPTHTLGRTTPSKSMWITFNGTVNRLRAPGCYGSSTVRRPYFLRLGPNPGQLIDVYDASSGVVNIPSASRETAEN